MQLLIQKVLDPLLYLGCSPNLCIKVTRLLTLCSTYFLKSQITAEEQMVQTDDLYQPDYVNPDGRARKGLLLIVSPLLCSVSPT